MRTTLTLDDDVAAAISRRRAQRGTRMRDEVNALLRAGLNADRGRARGEDGYEVPAFDSGQARIADPRALKELLDDENVQRAVGRASA